MASYLEDTGMSELEQEFELEMEGEPTESSELEASFEALDDREAEPDSETDTLQELEFEAGEDSEFEDTSSGYADRFYELSQREFESESERESSVQDVMREMETEFFLGKLVKGGIGLARKFKKAGGFSLLKTAAKQLAGPLSGQLGALASAALSMHPGGAAILPLLKTLGFGKSDAAPEQNQEAWNNFVSFSREAYDRLADSVGEREVANPALAAQRTAQAIAAARQQALRHLPARARGVLGQPPYAGAMRHGRRPVYRVRVPRSAIARGCIIKIIVT
jgi:hypothetical protein